MEVVKLAKYEEYQRLREMGMTYQAIADYYNVTKQAVYGSLHYQRTKSACRLAYPAITKRLVDHHVTIKEFEDRTGYRLYAGVRKGKLTSDRIDAILRETGLSYEDAFRCE